MQPSIELFITNPVLLNKTFIKLYYNNKTLIFSKISINIWFFSFLVSLIATGLAISAEEIVVCLKKFAIPAIPL